jgi:hypothetical protein
MPEGRGDLTNRRAVRDVQHSTSGYDFVSQKGAASRAVIGRPQRNWSTEPLRPGAHGRTKDAHCLLVRKTATLDAAQGP